MCKPNAILLLGPTGSGKTPFGEFLELKGLDGRRCFHFDFGAQLRDIAENKTKTALLSHTDLGIIKDSLITGNLLENENFHIAEKILLHFQQDRDINVDDRLLLNGLPRHKGQAENLTNTISIQTVIYLSCTPDTIMQRIFLNTGQDRTGRMDDSLELIKEKLRIFKARTLPLLEYYKHRQAEILEIEIGTDTQPEYIKQIMHK